MRRPSDTIVARTAGEYQDDKIARRFLEMDTLPDFITNVQTICNINLYNNRQEDKKEIMIEGDIYLHRQAAVENAFHLIFQGNRTTISATSHPLPQGDEQSVFSNSMNLAFLGNQDTLYCVIWILSCDISNRLSNSILSEVMNSFKEEVVNQCNSFCKSNNIPKKEVVFLLGLTEEIRQLHKDMTADRFMSNPPLVTRHHSQERFAKSLGFSPLFMRYFSSTFVCLDEETSEMRVVGLYSCSEPLSDFRANPARKKTSRKATQKKK